MGYALSAWHGASAPAPREGLPGVFAVTTALLFVASGSLQRALGMVRAERQAAFRRSLAMALTAGTLFLGAQGFGLSVLKGVLSPSEAHTGAYPFAFVFAVLHALHVSVAMLFLVFVTLQALADRYDHEYHWGVAVCTYFWHVLGLVWLCILGVFALAT